MNAAEIATALGSVRRSRPWWRCRCPVHDSRGATLALRDGERGLIVHCHAGCSRADVLAELRRRGLIEGREQSRALEPRLSRPDHGDDGRHNIEAARRIWNAARDAHGSPVVRYLAGRNIDMPVPPSLRWAPRCPHPSGLYLPAMVAKVVNVDCEVIGVHRTFLRPDGSGKADIEPQKASLGPISGGAVRLAPAAEVLMVGEGLESCLAGVEATGMPAWAALSANGMKALALPPIVRRVVILADNDANGTGEYAAHAAARCWLAEGRQAQIVMSPESGADLNDVLIAGTEPRHVAA